MMIIIKKKECIYGPSMKNELLWRGVQFESVCVDTHNKANRTASQRQACEVATRNGQIFGFIQFFTAKRHSEP